MSNRSSRDEDTELLPLPRHGQGSDCFASEAIDYDALEEHSETHSEHQPLQDEAQSKQSESRRGVDALFRGWKVTNFMSLVASVVVLFFNIGFLVFAATQPLQGTGRVLYEGSYAKVRHLSTGLHLVINFLSTALLSASNFAMQCLSAPTRQNIDQAHEQGRWLDIGVPSIRNLFRIPIKRLLLWLLLSLSSLPFHMVYNSVIYPTTATTAYNVFAGSGPLDQETWSDVHLKSVIGYEGNRTSRLIEKEKNFDIGDSLQGLFQASKKRTLKKLFNPECLVEFAQTYQTKYGRLLLVTGDIKENDSYTLIYTNPVYKSNSKLSSPGSPDYDSSDYQGESPYRWICLEGDLSCDVEKPAIIQGGKANSSWRVENRLSAWGDTDRVASNWQPDYKIEYCLAEEMPQHSRLQCSISLMIVVIIFNIVKSSVLLYMWLCIHDAPILTVGDAIASFLRRPDPYSLNRCLRDNCNMKHANSSLQVPARKTHLQSVFTGSRRLWGAAVSVRRWAFSLVIWAIAIIISLMLLGLALMGLEGINFNPWKQQLGAVTSKLQITTKGWPSDFVPNVLIANSPQLIFSLLYFAFNSLLTAMCFAAEWSSFAIQRKGLRVSNNPTATQRSTYFLSIPYRYAVPLSLTSCLLHWLISRSLFLVAIQAYDPNLERNPKGDVYNCAFSPVAIVSGLSVGSAMFLSLLGLSFRRFKSAMPVAGSCSLSIAAACHPTYNPNQDRRITENLAAQAEDSDEEMAYLPVQWGAVAVDGPIGHCTFTSEDVFPPEKGKRYQ